MRANPAFANVTLGIGGLLGHDANAALFVDGRLIASSQEERHTRVKHDGAFPRLAIADCLGLGNLAPSDVTDVVFAEKPLQTLLFNLSTLPGTYSPARWAGLYPSAGSGLYTKPARALLPRAQFHYAWHHLTHVTGAFHTSPFERAAFLCVDGKGEDYSASMGVISHGELRILRSRLTERARHVLHARDALPWLSFLWLRIQGDGPCALMAAPISFRSSPASSRPTTAAGSD